MGIEWKQFGVSLNFTPTVLANGRIALHVAPEVSELAPQQGVQISGVTVPGITTRRADTTVELGSGQTFAIAGLLQNQTQQQLQAYPWIGNIPIVGALFRSTAFQRGETELIILITPYMVAPVSSATALTSGVDGFRAPGDQDRVLNGAMNAPAVPGTAPPPPSQSGAAARGPVAAFAGAPAVTRGQPPRHAPTSGFEID
jgi:pilus assembly protein CpaC